MKTFVAATVSLAALALAGSAQAEVKVGAPAPGFSVVDSMGKTRTLDEFKGKTVVLEWHNNGCPYVKKHYNTGNMQALQKKYTQEGVVWLSVASSPEGAQGYVTAAEANAYAKDAGASPSAVLLDHKSEISRAYRAQVTPHMYVVDARGVLVYAGAIDDRPTTNPEDVKGAKNYVAQALDEIKAGKPVGTASTKAYGCYVKYAPQS
jgi:peroxiredoxin